MSRLKCFSPEFGYRFQIVFRLPGSREWEHCDYATDRADCRHLLANYRQVGGGQYRAVELPWKYWPKRLLPAASAASPGAAVPPAVS